MIRIVSYNQEAETEYTCDPVYTQMLSDSSFGRILMQYEGGKDDDIAGILTGGRFFVRNSQPLTGSYISSILRRYDCILPCPAGRLSEKGMIIAKEKVLSVLSDSLRGVEDPDDEDAVCEALICSLKEHSFRVKSENTSRNDSEMWNIGHRRIETLQGYVDAVLSEYIDLRKQTGFEDGFAESDPYTGDFGGKIPVWICWWQGLESASELVRACVDSVKRNLPESAQLILITYDNCYEYVTLTDAVRDRYERGIITPTHLSDILRAELLYRYGGMWIDATYYVSRPITDEFLRQELYSIRFDPPLWGMDIQKGRWTLSLIVSAKRHPAMQFLMEGLWLYWEYSDELADYFMVDYICDAGYRHIPGIRDAFDGISPSPPAVYDLQLAMNQRITPTGAEWLRNSSVFYKINRRNEYVIQTEHGFGTFYAYIMNQASDGSFDPVYSADKNVTVVGHSEADLIRILREVNPYRIVDVNGYFADNGWISKGILDDVIMHDLEIIRVADETDGSLTADVRDCLYDHMICDAGDMDTSVQIVMNDAYVLKCI